MTLTDLVTLAILVIGFSVWLSFDAEARNIALVSILHPFGGERKPNPPLEAVNKSSGPVPAKESVRN